MDINYIKRLEGMKNSLDSLIEKYGAFSAEVLSFIEKEGLPVPFGNVLVAGFKGNGKTSFGKWNFASPSKSALLGNSDIIYIEKRKLLLKSLIQVTPDLAAIGIPAFEEFQNIISRACFPFVNTQKKESAKRAAEKVEGLSEDEKSFVGEDEEDYIFNTIVYPQFISYSSNSVGKNVFNPWLKINFVKEKNYVLDRIVTVAVDEGFVNPDDYDALAGNESIILALIKKFKNALSRYSHCVLATESYEGTYADDKLVIESNHDQSSVNSRVSNPIFFRTDLRHGATVVYQPFLMLAVISALGDKPGVVSSANGNLFNGNLTSVLSDKGFDSTFIDVLNASSTSMGMIDATIILEVREDSSEQDRRIQAGLIERFASTGTLSVGVIDFTAAFLRFRNLAISSVVKEKAFFNSVNNSELHVGQELINMLFSLHKEFDDHRKEDGTVDFSNKEVVLSASTSYSQMLAKLADNS